jgi:glucosamine-6-phosphate deaminase
MSRLWPAAPFECPESGLLAPARPVLEVLPDGTAVAERVATLLLAALERGQTLGLATGRTMEPVYAALRRQLADGSLERRQLLLSRWRSFNLDEYVGLGAGDAGAFATEMTAALAHPLGLPPGCLQLPDGRAPDPLQEARRYSKAVAAAGGIGLQLLGLGSNGHVGFNEPPCPADAPCRCLVLSEATRRQNAAAFGGDPAAVPARAITLGTAEILAAEELLLVVTGAAKAEILRRSLQESPCAEVPASWLQRHPRLQVIVDAPAAAALQLS